MTLDLGFAHLCFDDGVEAGIVDVPGHERFLHNMLAGAAGMELLILVVDANEGVMPQTLEHLAILALLNVRRVLVVASKVDLIERGEATRALARIAQRLRDTIADDAPILPVSVLTGEGLDALRRTLHDEIAALPPPNADAPAYLPIDRAFVLPGLGTVVTGTLMQGAVAAGETLALEPSGAPAYVRSIGVFGSRRERVTAGARVALNVPGIERSAIARGQAIVGRELTARRSFAVRFVPSEGASLVRRRTPVRAYIGSAEILGTLIADPSDGPEPQRAAQLQLREPVVAFPGLRFVVRRPSPMTLLGGGFVVGVGLEARAPQDEPHEAAVLAVLRSCELEPLDVPTIASTTNLREAATADALHRLVERGDAIAVARPHAYVDGAAARDLLARACERLEASHREEPWAMGVTSIALSRALAVPERLLVRVLEHFAGEGRLMNRAGYYAAVSHEPTSTDEQRALFDSLVPIDEGRALLPSPFPEAMAAVRRSAVTGARKAFDTMLARGALVKVGDELYRGSQIANIRARVETHLRERERMTPAEFRDLIGTSRKYAVPLLEWLDAQSVTIRDGDYRRLRKRPQ